MLLLKVLWAFLSVGILGALLGLGLALASRFLSVKKDKRIERVEEALPGINCGACGFPGCEGYAAAIVTEGVELTLCKPGGNDALAELAEIMGVEAEGQGERQVAQVHCKGGRDSAEYKFSYEGISDCNAAQQLYGGAKVCPFGCLGHGSCVKVCPVDAIAYDNNGLVWVDRDICISCVKCVDICPTGVMKMIPDTADKIVACNSVDKGGVVRKYCKVGCIGCKRCEKSSPDGGFVVENFLAIIDYDKTGEREAAAEICPTKCIVPASDEEPIVEEIEAEERVTVSQDSHERD
ncbi:MAG: electron transporter RnfB [Spirochaetales bacterium]|nr:electron transporter RnfB [Spirochaetales bacterium]